MVSAGVLGLLLLSICSLLVSCGGRNARRELDQDQLVDSGPVLLGAAAARAVAPQLRGTFRTLEGAIRSGDERLAYGILERLAATQLGPGERRLAENLKRVLRGRQLSRAVELKLSLAPSASVGRWTLILELNQAQVESMTLRLPPLRLTYLQHRIDAGGIGSKQGRTLLLPVLSDLELHSGQPLLVSLGTFDAAMRGTLALRLEWRMELLGGSIETGGVEFPAAAFEEVRFEQTFLADFLPQEALGPEVLVEFARRPEPAMAPLIERAVRIPPGQADQALEALEPLLLEFAKNQPERVIPLAPALRWLSRSNDPGVDPAAWVRRIRARRERKAEEARTLERSLRRLDLSSDAPDGSPSSGRGNLQLPPKQEASGDS